MSWFLNTVLTSACVFFWGGCCFLFLFWIFFFFAYPPFQFVFTVFMTRPTSSVYPVNYLVFGVPLCPLKAT